MSLLDKINDDLKNAIKEKDEIKISAIRQIKNQITNTEIKKGKSLTEEEIYNVIFSLVKSHNESIESFKKGNRFDLVEKEEKELLILKSYLPKQLTEEEIKEIILNAIKEVNASSVKDIGKVMSNVMPKVKGKADGAKVKEIALQLLQK